MIKNEQRNKIDIFFPTRHTNNQQVHKKMLNISNHQGNENQNHNESSPHVY